jgi:hypothetical protein
LKRQVLSRAIEEILEREALSFYPKMATSTSNIAFWRTPAKECRPILGYGEALIISY